MSLDAAQTQYPPDTPGIIFSCFSLLLIFSIVINIDVILVFTQQHTYPNANAILHVRTHVQ